MMNKAGWIFIIFIIFIGCKQKNQNGANPSNESSNLFELKDNKIVGLEFSNNLEYDKDFNVYKYRNYYNGGGVGIGDINNDGLMDVYMVSNQKSNKLFLNKGNWQFEDITDKAQVGGSRAWSTGVSIADVNGDGLMDIYVCNSGDVKGDNKENELFINNGDLTFTESAAEYNLNDKGFSTHASFFDYDKDGDLDCYILNNSFQAIGSFNLKKSERPKRDELGGDKLMENRGGKFVDVSEKAGIYGSVIGFGLGVTVGDVNNDGWEDIFVSNDFFERDYLYINQRNGTFKEDLTNQITSISGASMGADIGDINNDGWNDIFVTEMLPSEYDRLKTNTTFEDWDRYQYGVKNGYHHQFTRNTLHLNNGNNTYSEVSRLSGVEASDWSWGALFFDMDLDGKKDLFIANGIYRDLTNQDYLQYVANESVMASIINDEGVDYKKLIDIIPSNPVANHAYKNEGNLKFSTFATSGLQTKGFSNGSAYGDMDNDGDLDLIVNNVNMPCFVYENKSNTTKANYLKLDLKSKSKNTKAVGATIKVKVGNEVLLYDNQPTRGFQSCMDYRPNIGLGSHTSVDLTIIWPSGKVSYIQNVKANQILSIDEPEISDTLDTNLNPSILLKLEEQTIFTHTENNFVDFNKERLVYHMMSTRGPCVSKGDVNGDGLEDIVTPGPKGSLNSVLIANKSGGYNSSSSQTFLDTKDAEKIKCNLFDVDQDRDLHLYVASGGTENSPFSDLLDDKIYHNDGKGNFSLSAFGLPTDKYNLSTGAIAHSDIDKDGDLDLFIGERVKVGDYGAACSGYILQNDGKGQFTDVTQNICPSLMNIGMITDAKFADLDGDGQEDLIVVGEFMKVEIFKNKKGKFEKVNGQENTYGWWNVIELVDVDGDNDMDLILGNLGLNSRFKADEKFPLSLYYNDFDQNGYPEGIIANKRADGKDYPFALRHNLMARLPMLKKKYPDFESYKNASISDIFTPEQLKSSTKYQVNLMKSIILVNKGKMNFEISELPIEVQMSPMFAIESYDIDQDGDQDLIMGGNLYGVQPEVGRYDASYGHVLINDGKGNFVDKAKEYGFVVKGEVRDILVQDGKILVFRNNDSTLSYQMIRNEN